MGVTNVVDAMWPRATWMSLALTLLWARTIFTATDNARKRSCGRYAVQSSESRMAPMKQTCLAGIR